MIIMDEERIREILKKAIKEGRKALYEFEAKEVARLLGIPTPKNIFIKDFYSLDVGKLDLREPYVIKIVSPQVIHKTDVGGVVLNVSREALEDEIKKMVERVRTRVPNAKIEGVLIEEMVEKGVETIVGLVKDPQFGPVVMFGLGGIFVEVYRDVSFRLAPLDKEEAISMIQEVKAYKILKGYRGIPPSDIEAIADVIVKVGDFGYKFQEVKELDINPLMAYPYGVNALDVRIILGE